MDFKRFIKIFVVEVIIFIICAICLVIVIDPFFHYHKPLSNIYYKLSGAYERYQNDGILRHFDYDAIITGTSMTENFKSSEVKALFGGEPVKVPFSGGSYKEINSNIAKAYKYEHDIDYVIRSLDMTHLNENPNVMRTDLGTYPEYLYNDNLFDDAFYIINKDTLKLSLQNIKESFKRKSGGYTNFDEYANWNNDFEFGEVAVNNKYIYYHQSAVINRLSKKEIKIIIQNVEQNVVELAKEHPETTFYYFFPPYSIAYWKELYTKGEIDSCIEAEKIAIEIILQIPNIKLYSFNLMSDITTDLNNYKDPTHYGEWINSKILVWMKNDIGLLTKDNYNEYLRQEYEFYNNYDYDSVFKKL